MLPHVVFSPMPAPSRESDPSATITTPIARNAIANRAGKTFGTICRTMICRSVMPIDLAAVTKSRLDQDIAVDRAIRPMIGMMTIVRETITTMRRRDGGTGFDGSGEVPNTEMSVIERSKFGMERTTLNIAFAKRSKIPLLKAARIPITDPITDPTITDMPAISNEYREPSTSCANMS